MHGGGGGVHGGGVCMGGVLCGSWTCMVGGMYGRRGYAWQEGCVWGGVCGRGMYGGGMYGRGYMAEGDTAADVTHPTGMLSC